MQTPSQHPLPLLLSLGFVLLPAGWQGGEKTPARPAQGKPVEEVREAEEPEKLLEPFDRVGLVGRLKMAWPISKLGEDALANHLLPHLTGERKQLTLQVSHLVQELTDVRWMKREQAEKNLINLGPRIKKILQGWDRASLDLEARIRLERVFTALRAMGDEDLLRRARLARGIAEALEYRSGKTETRALLLALDHLDLRVRLAAIRSLGTLLRDPALAAEFGGTFLDRIRSELDLPDLERRNAALTALGGIPTERCRDFLSGILLDPRKATSLRLLALRLLADREGSLEGHVEGTRDHPLLSRALAWFQDRGKGTVPDPLVKGDPPLMRVILKDEGRLSTSLLGLRGERLLFVPPEEYGKLPELRIPRSVIDTIRFEGREAALPGTGLLVLLKTGSRLFVEDPSFDGEVLTGTSFGRSIRLAKKELRILLPPGIGGRAFGGSRDHDQVRLAEKNAKPLEGRVLRADASRVLLEEKGKKASWFPWGDLRSVLFKLGRPRRQVQDIGDLNQYVQLDMNDGQSLVGFLLELRPHSIGIANEALGCLSLPLSEVSTLKLANSGRALTGFTLVTDFGGTRVVEVDGEGREVWQLEDLFDPLDAEILPNGNILVTELMDDAVREYDREGNVVWEFTSLNKPQEADRLPNGNTLIVDAGNRRVIEVDPGKRIVWRFDVKNAGSKSFKPYDADRLLGGNTLICDLEDGRVLEVDHAGKTVWQMKGLRTVYDADRLPNGNTLITQLDVNRKPRVIEVTRNHTIVWSLTPGPSPSDADRLPDGTTIVAGDGGVRVYNKEGKVLRKIDADWAWEANGY